MKKNTGNSSEQDKKTHWEQVYSAKQSTEVSWYQQHPERSLELIRATDVDFSAGIIDIGGGASTLVDCMLAAGYRDITVLDIAHAAIEQAKLRLDDAADKVKWIEQDVTTFDTQTLFDVWHDRAVFHFLTDPLDRSSYVHVMTRLLKPGAYAILATFALDGPEKCSGLEVVRYNADTLSAVLGDSFQLVDSCTESHVTPNAATQSFIYCLFKKSF